MTKYFFKQHIGKGRFVGLTKKEYEIYLSAGLRKIFSAERATVSFDKKNKAILLTPSNGAKSSYKLSNKKDCGVIIKLRDKEMPVGRYLFAKKHKDGIICVYELE